MKMITQNHFLSSRIREVFLNGTWIANTNYYDQLKDLNLDTVVKKIGDLNTIAALTFHINYYLAGLISAFDTGKLEISDKHSFDLTPLRSEDEWDTLKNELFKNAETFAAKVDEMDPELLEKPFITEKYGSYLRNIEGVIEHSYYHLGQIVLIKKMITSNIY